MNKMPNKRPIPPVNTKEYATQGEVMVKPSYPYVSMEVHFCTVLLQEDEALVAMLSLCKACRSVWGDSFVEKFDCAKQVL
jgi:hypothetical protein